LAEQQPIVDFSLFEAHRVVADRDEVQRVIPQRFEMSQLDGTLFEDAEGLRVVGYKDTSQDEFWVRGHMPEFALMPGVIMCESAAQVIAYMARKFDFADEGIMAFGGMDRVRFRNMVLPGDRLVTMVVARKLRRNVMVVCDFQGYVGDKLVVDGEIKGVVLRPEYAKPRP
jgi:3-hydroxyacyl-[acyl-carrier-protein] dehydratase